MRGEGRERPAGTLSVMASHELERLLEPGYLGDLQRRPLEEVRAMRSECQQVEVGLSYLRRLAQARLDIIAGELRRRTEGGDPSDLSDLIGKLPEILADRVHAPGIGRLPQHLAPGDSEQDLQSELEAIVSEGGLASLPEMDEEHVRRLEEALVAFEHDVSANRRELHQRIDALQAEITRRYQTGEANVDTLLS
jgi:hypothetical protein